MPVCRIKCRERPGKSRGSNTTVHHWIFLDISRVIETYKLMPHHLRVNRERHNTQPSSDEEIDSTEKCSLTTAGCDRLFASQANITSLSLSGFVFGHSVREMRPQERHRASRTGANAGSVVHLCVSSKPITPRKKASDLSRSEIFRCVWPIPTRRPVVRRFLSGVNIFRNSAGTANATSIRLRR